jgi:hypothetical protein
MPLENYETVAERIEKFWMFWPNGRIDQKLIYQDGTRYIVQTDLYKDFGDPVPYATDFAEEIRSSANRFPCENAATSSLGRSLHTGGISKFSEGIARESADRMERVNLSIVPDSEFATVGASMDVMVKEIYEGVTHSEKPQCSHGYMLEKAGVGKTGKPYSGYVCGSKTNQCKPIWN